MLLCHHKVSEKDPIDEAKVVTIGTTRVSTGKQNLLLSFDNFSHASAAEFVKDLMTKSDFIFFNKSGMRLCLHDRKSRKALLDLLNRHKRAKTKIVRPTRYLYFHDMRPRNAADPSGKKVIHKLSHHQPKKHKAQSRKQLADLGKVLSQFTFPIRQEMLYCSPKLHLRPHGSVLSTDMNKSNKRLAKLEIPNFVCSKRMTKSVGYSDFKVVCPGAQEFVWFHQNVQLDKKLFLEFLVDHGKFDVVRDNKKIGKRINIGFGQNQKIGDSQQLCLHGPSWWKWDKGKKVPLVDDPQVRKLPTLNTKWLDEMKAESGKLKKDYSKLKNQLAQILSFGQACFDSYYQNEGKPFADDFRNNLFGNYLHSFFPEGSFRWEFIDITIQHFDEILPRHMDYKNSTTEGYDHCVVYSFTVDQFRVCFIMTSRQNCAAASTRLESLMSYPINL
jgi:hypothetical protein